MNKIAIAVAVSLGMAVSPMALAGPCHHHHHHHHHQGQQGPKGNTGAQGPHGVAGQNGLNGRNGATGKTGATGPQGKTGPAGPDAAIKYTDGLNGSTSSVPTNTAMAGTWTTGPVTITNVAGGAIAAGSHQAVNGGQIHQIEGEGIALINNTAKSTLASANSYTDGQIYHAEKAGVKYVNKVAGQTLNSANSYTDKVASKTLNKSENYTNGSITHLKNQYSKSFTTKDLTAQNATIGNLKVKGNQSVGGNLTVGGQITANGANMDNHVIQNVAAGTSPGDAANVGQVQQGDAQTLQAANSYTNSQVNQGEQYAANIAQNDANNAQQAAQNFAASGIAAALAMPASPILCPGDAAVGVETGGYAGYEALGAKFTYQVSRHFSVNAGVSSGFGNYGHVAWDAGGTYVFGANNG